MTFGSNDHNEIKYFTRGKCASIDATLFSYYIRIMLFAAFFWDHYH